MMSPFYKHRCRWSICSIHHLVFLKEIGIALLLACLTIHHADAAMHLHRDGSITDQNGRKFQIKTAYQRIISLYGAHTENLFALGAGDQVVGVGSNELYPPEALNKPTFSYRNDAEKFLAARPDLILIRPMIARAYPALIHRMTQSGIAVVSLQPANLTEMYTYWRILGRLCGREQRAAQMVAAFQRRVRSFEKLAHSITPKKRVYLEAIHDQMKTVTPDAMAAVVLTLAGGINVAADAPQVRRTNIAYYGKERILSKAGQIDVFLAQVGAMNRPTIELILNEPGFHMIKAVQSKQVHLIDEAIISRPTQRLLTGIYTIGRILYPTHYNRKGEEILNGTDLIRKEVSH